MYELELIASEGDLEDPVVVLRSVEEVRSYYGSLLGEPMVSALRFVECGDLFAGFGLLDEALECCGRAIAKDGGCLRGYLLRGELYFQSAVCASSEDSRQVLGGKAVEDFRRALMLSLGTSDVVWSLGMALLLVGEPVGVEGLAENVLTKGDLLAISVRCDFLYLLGLAHTFGGSRNGAEEAFESLIREHENTAAIGWFGKTVADLVLGDGSGVDAFLRELEHLDCELLEAGRSLQLSGCAAFVDVVRALSSSGVAVVKKRK